MTWFLHSLQLHAFVTVSYQARYTFITYSILQNVGDTPVPIIYYRLLSLIVNHYRLIYVLIMVEMMLVSCNTFLVLFIVLWAGHLGFLISV